MSELGPLTLGTLSRETPVAVSFSAPGGATGHGQASARGAALGSLMEEVVSLSRQLHRAAQESDGPTWGQREVLTELERQGPRTVPRLARSRSLSRQQVQSQVNVLASLGNVELVTNPEHKRSRLVRLTEAGKRYLVEREQADARSLSALGVDVSKEQISRAVELLREVNVSLKQRGAR